MGLIKVTRVKALEGARLDLAFSDGTHGVADLAADLTGPLAPLRDAELWATAHLRHGVVTWTDDLDLAPELLYARAHGLDAPRTVLRLDIG